jgi:hypothetical protein
MFQAMKLKLCHSREKIHTHAHPEHSFGLFCPLMSVGGTTEQQTACVVQAFVLVHALHVY